MQRRNKAKDAGYARALLYNREYEIGVVELEKQAKRDLAQVPNYIKDKLLLWVDDVARIGVQKVREVPGYHDEPLKGDRVGQRSIRLNRDYCAIYIERPNKEIIIISVMEVNKHGY